MSSFEKMLVDVHSHLYFTHFDEDREEVIKRAKDVGAVALLNAGTDHKSNLEVLELAKKHDVVKATLGIYPTDAMEMGDETLKKELAFIKKHKDLIVGIGEIGLDFHLTKDLKKHKRQIEVFKEIITTLQPLDMPFIIHSRKAEEKCVEILEELKVKKAVFHCFSGKYKLVERIAKNNWFLSIPANVQNSMHFQGVVEKVSINNLLTETDAPFLAPHGQDRSEPAFIIDTLQKIADIKKMDVKEVKKNIFLNYQKLFM